ncbi:MAG: hypothetical protein RL701_8100 [Pseudomonadota bacterium]
MTTHEAATTTRDDLTAWKPRLLHVAYYVADIERALGFYKGVLGLRELMRIPLGDGMQEVVLAFPDSQGAGVILMWHDQKQAPRTHGNGYSRFVLSVSNLDAALAHVLKHGAPLVTPATIVGPMKYAMVKDPDGYVIELLEFLKA